MDINLIKKQTNKKKKSVYGKSLLMSLSVVLTGIVCVIISYFFKLSLIITIPLILIPVYIVSLLNFLSASNTQGYKFNLKTSLRYFMCGLSRDMQRGFNILKNSFRAMAISSIIFLLGFFILWLIPEYRSDIVELVRLLFSMDIKVLGTTINSLLNNSIGTKNAIAVLIIISKGVGVLYFVFNLLMSTLEITTKSAGIIPLGKRRYGYDKVYRKHRKTYFKGLIYFNGFGFFMMFVGFIFGIILMILKGQYALALPLGVIFLLLMMIPVLQNYYIYNEQVLIQLSPKIQMECAQEMKKMMKKIFQSDDLSDEHREMLKKILAEPILDDDGFEVGSNEDEEDDITEEK